MNCFGLPSPVIWNKKRNSFEIFLFQCVAGKGILWQGWEQARFLSVSICFYTFFLLGLHLTIIHCIFASVFHRILDFKTRQHFYAAFFYALVVLRINFLVNYDCDGKYHTGKTGQNCCCAANASGLVLLQKLIGRHYQSYPILRKTNESKYPKTKNPVSVNFFFPHPI